MAGGIDPVPEWLISARDAVDTLRRDLEQIETAATEQMRQASEIATRARQLGNISVYLSDVLNDSAIPPEAWHSPDVSRLGIGVKGTLNAGAISIGRLADIYQPMGHSGQVRFLDVVELLDRSESVSASAANAVAEISREFAESLPDFSPRRTPVDTNWLNSPQQVRQDLANLLQPFDAKYLRMLEGAQEALRISGADSFSQAAHSMRDLVQQLIEALAPSEAVRKQSWFTCVEGTPDGVSRRARLKYILYGSGEGFSAEQLDALETLADNAKMALDRCMGEAHSHDPQRKRTDVEYAISQTALHLREVLRRRLQK